MQAEDNLARAEAIRRLHEDTKNRLPDVTRTLYAVQVLDWVFEHPVFSSTQFVDQIDSSRPTARRILQRLCEAGILRKIYSGRGRRPGVFAFLALLHVAEGGEPSKPEEQKE